MNLVPSPSFLHLWGPLVSTGGTEGYRQVKGFPPREVGREQLTASGKQDTSSVQNGGKKSKPAKNSSTQANAFDQAKFKLLLIRC